MHALEALELELSLNKKQIQLEHAQIIVYTYIIHTAHKMTLKFNTRRMIRVEIPSLTRFKEACKLS
jgi:hypothetical protein